MSDTRHKDANWNPDECPTSGKANVALLMDLRDELKELHTVAHGCQHAILRELRGMRRDLKKLRRAE